MVITLVTLSLALVATVVGILGETWNQRESGIRKLTPIGRAVLVVAIASFATSVYQSVQEHEQAQRESARADSLELNISQILSVSMLQVEQQLVRDGSDARLVPRVALFASTTCTDGTIANSSIGSADELLQWLFADLPKPKQARVSAQMFDGFLSGSRSIESDQPEQSSESSNLVVVYAGRIRDPEQGQLSIGAILQASSERDVASLVRSVLSRSGFIEIDVEATPNQATDHAALRGSLRTRMAQGFGYFHLACKGSPSGGAERPALVFELDPKEPQTLSESRVRLRWSVGKITRLGRAS